MEPLGKHRFTTKKAKLGIKLYNHELMKNGYKVKHHFYAEYCSLDYYILKVEKDDECLTLYASVKTLIHWTGEKSGNNKLQYDVLVGTGMFICPTCKNPQEIRWSIVGIQEDKCNQCKFKEEQRPLPHIKDASITESENYMLDKLRITRKHGTTRYSLISSTEKAIPF